MTFPSDSRKSYFRSTDWYLEHENLLHMHDATKFPYSNSSFSSNRIILEVARGYNWVVHNCWCRARSSSLHIYTNILAVLFPCYVLITGAIRFSKACWLSSVWLPTAYKSLWTTMRCHCMQSYWSRWPWRSWMALHRPRNPRRYKVFKESVGYSTTEFSAYTPKTKW